jgi:hypothetical protein
MLKWLKDKWLLLTILLLAAWFRAGGISNFDYHHDELSALLRTRFSDFDSLIAKGVAIDGHPAFTQIFLWIYTEIFGFESCVVKLPFTIAGVLSVWLGFSIAKKLFGESAGYVSTMLLAILQYGIIYSQWARPYSFGLFFVLLSFLGLVNFRKYNRALDLLVFALATALAGLTHYFALLQVIIVTLIWWLWQSKADKKSILIASCWAFLLFLPHWSITMNHLEIGGIGEWLQKPKPDFWWQVIQFVFHYHWLIPAFLFVFVLLGFKQIPISKEHWFNRLLLVISLVLPFVIAYYYSLHVSALLHFGTVFFSFPFFIFLISSFIAIPKPKLPLLLVVLTLFGSAQVWIGRKHKALNQSTEYMGPFKFAAELQHRPTLLFDLRQDAIKLMADKNGLDTSNLYFPWDFWENNAYQNFVDDLKEDTVMVVVTPSSNQEYLSALLWKYPFVEAMKGYQSGTVYLLSNRQDTAERMAYYNAIEFDSAMGALTAQNPYTVGLKDKLKINESQNFWIGATYSATQMPDAAMVVELFDGETSIGAFQAELKKTYNPDSINQRVAWCIDGVDLRKHDSVSVKAFLWNKGSVPFQAEAIFLKTFRGNELKYKLFEPIGD